MNKVTRLVLLLLLSVSVLAFAVITARHIYANAYKSTPSTVYSPQLVCNEDKTKLLGFINAERVRLGLTPLVETAALETSSKAKLDDMVTNKYYGHYLLNGENEFGYITAQGIKGEVSSDIDINAYNPALEWKAFKGSPAHYASLTSPKYTRVGITSECVDYNIEKFTGPDVATKPVGTHVDSLTVVHLAF